ncbi:hypothetical protein METBIDRAFT_43529 [Metschnikowia bicuspidata var. bicuspidata NRRL YB-4993]|uniref:Trafficking protein particle complex subunit n=1 Tax=Metschnikowia bicuspidata var. bicuspidata NRRL YB-4993 TaxID=869754 RepID=A0A1A0H905_9ASCO|nr:hypothetical protein METBIDRAFT_43529 [Metschnikowia bicuspidata var. bicuspidata NRRL YB-4993]OBA20363.1 hypothetical protein METBIDRAFT_43529 [Metschnikowia bicuspidata var. bicuspidata NRRL YB-4993]
MIIYSLYILNKAGGLIYQNDLNPGLARLNANDYLVLAGTLHGVHAIATRIRPVDNTIPQDEVPSANTSILTSGKAKLPNTNSLGLQHMDTDLFSLYVFQTLTGLKFVIITSPGKSGQQNNQTRGGSSSTSKGDLTRQFQSVGAVYKEIYQFYCDYVMKNPFYALYMPIKCAMFEQKVRAMANIRITV